MVDHEFEGEGRSLDYFAPTATVGALGDPPPPVGKRTLQQLFTLSSLGCLPRLLVFVEFVEDETGALALLQLESRHSATVWARSEWHHPAKFQVPPSPSEDHPALEELEVVFLARVAEAGA